MSQVAERSRRGSLKSDTKKQKKKTAETKEKTAKAKQERRRASTARKRQEAKDELERKELHARCEALSRTLKDQLLEWARLKELKLEPLHGGAPVEDNVRVEIDRRRDKDGYSVVVTMAFCGIECFVEYGRPGYWNLGSEIIFKADRYSTGSSCGGTSRKLPNLESCRKLADGLGATVPVDVVASYMLDVHTTVYTFYKLVCHPALNVSVVSS